jgi:GNAT superfamily N-acetyltransferase
MALETENLALDTIDVTNGVESVFHDPRKGKYFVVEQRKKLIASALITYEWSDWRNQYVYWLQSVYVVPAWRRNGVFRLLYTHILETEIKNNENVAGLRLYVDKTNEKAMKVYQKMGMRGDHYGLYEWMKN